MSKKTDNMTMNNMTDNIDAMRALMDLFDCELYVVQHIIETMGDCYYADVEENKVYHAFLFMFTDSQGDIHIYVNIPEKQKQIDLDPLEVWIYCSKNSEDLDTYIGAQ